MKNLFIILSILFCSRALAQDPDLFQTWYLQDIYLEFGPPLHLLEPPVYPYLVISENLEFSGQGSCNTFTGTYEYDPIEDTMGYIEFSRTNMDCVFEYHNQFEDQYFWAVRGWWYYEITDDGTGQRLHLYHPFPELSATFTNYPLSVPNFEKVNITVYPNPANSKVMIDARGNYITKIELNNLLGEILPVTLGSSGAIDISHLASGIYLLRIITEEGFVVKKIIKK